MGFIKQSLQKVLIGLIYCYRYFIAGLFGHCCRFEPSCSTYAIEAVRIHGSCKGCVLTLRRLLRCHPWHPGGLDPVPKR